MTSLAAITTTRGAKPTTSALFSATEFGNSAAVAVLLEASGGVVDPRDESGATPLIVAAIQGQVEIIKALLDLGADANAADDQGCTALHLASLGGDKPPGMVTMLVEAGGAHVDAVNKSGYTPLYEAIKRQAPNTIRELVHCDGANWATVIHHDFRMAAMDLFDRGLRAKIYDFDIHADRPLLAELVAMLSKYDYDGNGDDVSEFIAIFTA